MINQFLFVFPPPISIYKNISMLVTLQPHRDLFLTRNWWTQQDPICPGLGWLSKSCENQLHYPLRFGSWSWVPLFCSAMDWFTQLGPHKSLFVATVLSTAHPEMRDGLREPGLGLECWRLLSSLALDLPPWDFRISIRAWVCWGSPRLASHFPKTTGCPDLLYCCQEGKLLWGRPSATLCCWPHQGFCEIPESQVSPIS